MIQTARQALAIALSTLAGFVDAIGYLAVGSLFVAFMSGNSTILGISVVEGLGARAYHAGGVVACFVGGVMLGTWLGRPFAERRAPVILLAVALLLAAAALLARARGAFPCALLAALAMGAENTVFQRQGESGLGLTYMTGTLVRFGQRMAEAVTGGPWRQALQDLLLWLGMVAGSCLGALAYRDLQLDALWIAVGGALVTAGAAWAALPPRPEARR